MSKELTEDLGFKEDQDSRYRFCSDNLNFSTVAHDIEDHVYQKKKIMRDPMSHRIIEKRRRDRMNNCLADLSRLIPPDYLKKGRGRIEKTEIIEMAIKHMRHLQNIISSSRMTGPRDDVSAASRSVAMSNREVGNPTAAIHQPISTEHYRLGYLECLSEAMHFLVEVQGYFAGDSLCVQMINHLHKHCDKILKTNSLNYPREHSTETTSSNSSASPTNGNYVNNSPFSRPSFSNGSNNSDENHANERFFENGRTFEPNDDLSANVTDDFRLPRNCSDLPRDYKKPISDSHHPRYSEIEMERTSENPSDSDIEQGYASKRKPDHGRNIHDDVSNYDTTVTGSRDYSLSSGIGSSGECPMTYDNVNVGEEKGQSQLRIMLTSPKTVILYNANGETSTPLSEMKNHSSPKVQPSECNASLKDELVNRKSLPTANMPHRCQTEDPISVQQYPSINCEIVREFRRGNDETFSAADTHGNMYKFKNNIKQRFSKERRYHENLDWECAKKLKFGFTAENYPDPDPDPDPDRCESCGTGNGRKYTDPLLQERLQLLEQGENDRGYRQRCRHFSESEIQIQTENESSDRMEFSSAPRLTDRNEAPISTRARWRKWIENEETFRAHLPSPFSKLKKAAGQEPAGGDRKPVELLTTAQDFPLESLLESKFRGKERSEDNVRVPVFALHAKGLFYVPLTLDRSLLSPFSSSLGLTDYSEESAEKPALHPVTISVNYEISLSSSNLGRTEKPWKSPG